MDITFAGEQELFFRYQKTQDAAMLDEILRQYSYIADILARRFVGKGLEFDDIYQSASIGLMNAAKRFDPQRGTRFSTFAAPTILGEIKRLFRDKGNCIRVPRRLYEIFSKANKMRNEELVKNGKMPSYAELSEALNVSQEKLAQAMLWGDTREVHSLEQPLDDRDVILFDCLGMEDNEFLMIENKDFIESFMQALPEREQQFLKYRYYEEMTQSQIAKLLGTSQMNISRLEKKLLAHLRQLYGQSMT